MMTPTMMIASRNSLRRAAACMRIPRCESVWTLTDDRFMKQMFASDSACSGDRHHNGFANSSAISITKAVVILVL